MTRFYSEYQINDLHIGCTGQTVIAYNSITEQEVFSYKIPYVYEGMFVPGMDAFIVKSTKGYLVRIDLKTEEIVKIRVSKSVQDGGYAICPWDLCLYNVEQIKGLFQIAIYDTKNLVMKDIIPIKGNIINVFDVEFDCSEQTWYLSLSYMYDLYQNVTKHAVVKMKDKELVEVRNCSMSDLLNVTNYKGFERCNFTPKSLQIYRIDDSSRNNRYTLKDLFSKS